MCSNIQQVILQRNYCVFLQDLKLLQATAQLDKCLVNFYWSFPDFKTLRFTHRNVEKVVGKVINDRNIILCVICNFTEFLPLYFVTQPFCRHGFFILLWLETKTLSIIGYFYEAHNDFWDWKGVIWMCMLKLTWYWWNLWSTSRKYFCQPLWNIFSWSCLWNWWVVCWTDCLFDQF